MYFDQKGSQARLDLFWFYNLQASPNLWATQPAGYLAWGQPGLSATCTQPEGYPA